MPDSQVSLQCPACGTTLASGGESDGLCPGCMLDLALDSQSRFTELLSKAEGTDEEATLAASQVLFAPGKILGKRYHVRKRVGRGGMGEVWRAVDLKLRVEVALKAMHEALFRDQRRRELLRQEVRAAREVVSPNVCRIFDLIEIDGHELVSMEYVDGQTLLAVLQERDPLELQEALEIASQFMVGLEAIHHAGLIHRDIKPENIMLTRAGRVVLMDFGLARDEESSTKTIAGTPAYMAPEQAAGLQVDARADVYSAGIVLAEMVNPGGVRDPASRKSLWEGLRSDPPQLPDTAWAPVIEKAVAKEREQRYDSAHALIRALEEVTLRVAGAEDLRPYPGLEVFTADDAEYFFGREAEVEQLWRKLEGPARLLAMVGPSGAGKSSFVRAGLLPAKPESWQALIATPGNRPFTFLAQALLPELQSDANALEDLLRFEEPEVAVGLLTAWRRRRRHGLLVIDQFEELFTLNPDEVQERFAELLHRLALEAQVHVLLSMRDDFLFHCHRFEALQPVFSEITPLGPPTGAALRRAVVQPALKCGYRFENEALVEAMISEVGDERGTLPLIAFACAQLWQHRDRDQGLLTQAAYDEIGGVVGALAQHAEATLERIGTQLSPMVRELFRNLVTSQGTRAPRGRNELLSVFPKEERETVDTVLDALVDARLLVSYEARSDEMEVAGN